MFLGHFNHSRETLLPRICKLILISLLFTHLYEKYVTRKEESRGDLPLEQEGNLNKSLHFNHDEDAKALYDDFTEGEEYIPNQYLSATKSKVYNEDGQVQIYIENARKGKDLGIVNDMKS